MVSYRISRGQSTGQRITLFYTVHIISPTRPWMAVFKSNLNSRAIFRVWQQWNIILLLLTRQLGRTLEGWEGVGGNPEVWMFARIPHRQKCTVTPLHAFASPVHSVTTVKIKHICFYCASQSWHQRSHTIRATYTVCEQLVFKIAALLFCSLLLLTLNQPRLCPDSTKLNSVRVSFTYNNIKALKCRNIVNISTCIRIFFLTPLVRLLVTHQHLAVKLQLFTLDTVIFALDRCWVCVWILCVSLSNNQWINVLFLFYIILGDDGLELRHSYWLSTTCFPDSSPHQHVNIQYISLSSESCSCCSVLVFVDDNGKLFWWLHYFWGKVFVQKLVLRSPHQTFKVWHHLWI